MKKLIILATIAHLLLLASVAAGLFLVAQRIHEVDQDVDNCADFLQILSEPAK